MRISKSSLTSRASERSAAAAPAVSGSKFTTIFLLKRASRRACGSVKAVPLEAMTLWNPALKTEMQSIWPSTRTM